jgi:hypothetical protein
MPAALKTVVRLAQLVLPARSLLAATSEIEVIIRDFESSSNVLANDVLSLLAPCGIFKLRMVLAFSTVTVSLQQVGHGR